ncbi:bifunctional folylpolyglutamate synthase/dihydrofolate synthase [Pedobacter sp. PWIIR3]
MDYKTTIEYLYERLPMFTRIGAVAFKKDLHNTIALCNALGNPENKFKSVHIAGTNGKGSTSHMLAAIFQQAGYKTGLYTSPHLKDFRERIKINGVMVTENFVVEFVTHQKALIEELNPSFFEVTVAMAFSYFEKEQVDIAIIEVGLGGRLDSTNIINPELSVITNISLDHTNILGNTITEIASEKAGIIKSSVSIVIGEHDTEADPVFINKAAETQSAINFASGDLKVIDIKPNAELLQLSVANDDGILYKDLLLDLTGSYQQKNLLTVLKAIELLNSKGFPVDESAIRNALRNVKSLTGLQGRWQILGSHPLIICDTGHNQAGIQEVVKNIKATPYDKLHMVIGMVKDKDISGVLQQLPIEATYYFCQPHLERALPAIELMESAKMFNLNGDSYQSVSKALEAAKANAGEKDLIFVGGSTFVVAEIL